MTPTVIPDPTCFGACSGCGRRGVPYEHRGLLFGGLCAYRGERLCPPCREAAMAGTGVSILPVDSRWRPAVPPHVVNSVRDRDTVFPGPATPEQQPGHAPPGSYGVHPAVRKIARWRREGLVTEKEQDDGTV
jgi:hypothetical protein